MTMFEGEYKVDIDKAGDGLWIGRVSQDGLCVLGYIRKYTRQDGSETAFSSGVAGLELPMDTFESLFGNACLMLDEKLQAGEDIQTGRNGGEYVVFDDQDAGVYLRAFRSQKNPENTVVAWRFTAGPLAGLNGFLTVTNGRAGRYVVLTSRQGVASLRARFVTNVKVAPIQTVQMKNGATKEKALIDQAFWTPRIRNIDDAYALWNGMMFQSIINAEANNVLFPKAEEPEEEVVEEAAEAVAAPF